MPPDEFRRHGARPGRLDRPLLRARRALSRPSAGAARRPPSSSCRPQAPEARRAFRAAARRPRALILPHAHALEPPRLLRLLRHHRQRARRADGDSVSAALNQQAMLWRTSPAATELEEVTLALAAPPDGPARCVRGRHLRHRLDLHAARAGGGARARDARRARARARRHAPDIAGCRVYCSEHAHSSVDKAVIALGLGHESLRAHPCRCRVPHARRRAARKRSTATVAAGLHAGCRRRHRRHDVDDQRRPGGGRLPAMCAATRHLAARRRRVCRRDGDGARASSALRRLGSTRRLDRRQPAQVAVHAVRSQRAVLLPPHGRGARGVLARRPNT